MRSCCVGALVAAVLSLPPSLPAQERALPPRGSDGPAMVATGRWLFVVRGDVLYQFDVDSLALQRTFRFPAAGELPAAGGPPPAAARPEPVVAEPPPSPPHSAEQRATSAKAALRWLANHQDDDGRWDCDQFMKHDDPSSDPSDGPGNPVHDVGVTGLALLAMLGDGSTLRGGTYKDAIKKGVLWLRNQQQENGLFGSNASHDFVYDHAIATLAVTEAFGLSNYRLLQEPAQRGLDYLESHRNPYAVWRYQPRDNDNDTSVTTWAAMAMVSGDAFGLRINREVRKLVAVWYDQVTTPDGRAGYSKAGERSSRLPGDHATRFPVENGEAMTAAAACGRLLLGQTPETKPILQLAAARLAARPPRWAPGHVDAVYWYFGSLAMAGLDGEGAAGWQRALGTLVDHQRTDGNFAGSWDPVGVWDEVGGRVMVTALYALCLKASLPAARRQRR